LDVPELGWTVVVTTNKDFSRAKKIAADLANHAWANRRSFYNRKVEPADAVAQAASHPEGPVVLADGADATNAGSPGDSTCLLLEMIRQNIQCKALLTIVDPESVEIAYQAGLGNQVSVSLGAKRSRRYHAPAEVTGKVIRFSDG
jgi:microcystin degradation protein MlrC